MNVQLVFLAILGAAIAASWALHFLATNGYFDALVPVNRFETAPIRRRTVQRLSAHNVERLWQAKMARFCAQNYQNRQPRELPALPVMSTVPEPLIGGLTAGQREMLDNIASGKIRIVWAETGQPVGQEHIAKLGGVAKKSVNDHIKEYRAKVDAAAREREEAEIAARMAAAASAPRVYEKRPKGVGVDLPDDVLTLQSAAA